MTFALGSASIVNSKKDEEPWLDMCYNDMGSGHAPLHTKQLMQSIA